MSPENSAKPEEQTEVIEEQTEAIEEQTVTQTIEMETGRPGSPAADRPTEPLPAATLQASGPQARPATTQDQPTAVYPAQGAPTQRTAAQGAPAQGAPTQHTTVQSAPAHPMQRGPETGPNQNIQVGLLVWSAVLIIVGAILVIVPALGIPTFQGVVVSMFALAGLAFLGLALYIAKNGRF